MLAGWPITNRGQSLTIHKDRSSSKALATTRNYLLTRIDYINALLNKNVWPIAKDYAMPGLRLVFHSLN